MGGDGDGGGGWSEAPARGKKPAKNGASSSSNPSPPGAKAPAAPRPQSVPPSVGSNLLQDLSRISGGMVFGCKSDTFGENMSRQVTGRHCQHLPHHRHLCLTTATSTSHLLLMSRQIFGLPKAHIKRCVRLHLLASTTSTSTLLSPPHLHPQDQRGVQRQHRPLSVQLLVT